MRRKSEERGISMGAQIPSIFSGEKPRQALMEKPPARKKGEKCSSKNPPCLQNERRKHLSCN